MSECAAERAIVLGPPTTRTVKLKLTLMLAYAIGWLLIPSLLSRKFQFVFPGLCSALIIVPLVLWILPKVVKLPPSNAHRISKELVEKFEQLRIRLGFQHLVLQSMITAKHPQAAVMNESVNLSEHVLNTWPDEAILWQSEVELRATKKVVPILVGYSLIAFPLCGMIPVYQAHPIFPMFVALLSASAVVFFVFLYRAETHALLAIDKEVTITEEARAAAKIALSDPYFYAENMKWYDRPLSISPKWLRRRADALGIKLERINEPAT